MRAPARGRDPGGQLTLFDVFELTAAVGVCIVGFQIGYMTWGWLGAIALALGGLGVGVVVGRIPGALTLAFLQRDLRRCDTATLKERLRSQYYLSHFIVPILRRRGEAERDLQEQTLSLLLAESSDERWHAWRTVNLCFPDLAERLRGIDVRGAPQRYQELIQRVRTELGSVRQR